MKAISIAAATLFATVTGGPSFAQTEGVSALEEIVVTATKREEKLSNIPAAINAVSASTIQTLGITKVDDYVGLIPNVSQVSQGAPGNSTIIIRGMYTGTASLTSTTAYYLDESALTASAFTSVATFISPDADLADVERIEVLKGPQGTLYGANAFGGILRIISKKPDPTSVSGSVGTDFASVDGGDTGYAVRGSLNLPLVQDKAAVRINAFHRTDPGYVDNVGTGHRDVNQADIDGARIALRWLPSDRWTLDLNAFYQSIDARSFAYEFDDQVTLTPAFGPYQYSSTRDLGSKTYYRTFGGTLAYATDSGTFTATAGYAKYDTAPKVDSSNLYAPFVEPPSPFAFAEPGATIIGTNSVAAKKTTAEVRYASDRLGRIEFLVGGFYTKEDNLFHPVIPIVNPDGSRPAAFGGMLLDSPNPALYKEYAGFGNLTFYLTDTLDVTGGFRYSRNKQDIDSQTFGFFSVFFPNALYHFDDTANNYLATLRWRPNESTNFYLRAASGYRPGGPNIGAPSFPPALSDTVWSYEGGVKGNLSQGLFYYDLSVYHIDWQDVQLPGQDPISSSQITTNGGGARVEGVELETTLRPLAGLSVTAALGYNKTKLTSVAPDVTNVIGAVAGDRLPLSPKWTAALIADYSRSLSSRLDGNVGATFVAAGERNATYPGDPVNVSLPSYETLDLRAGITLNQRYRIVVRVENVTNKDNVETYSTSRLFPGQPGVYSNAIRNRPRTFMLSAEADF